VIVGCALALPLAVSLVAAAADVGLGLRGEERSGALAPTGLPATGRESLSVTPRAALLVAGPELRLTAGYEARIWTSDVGAQPTPFVNHAVELRLKTDHDRPWNAEALVSALRGTTDPLADAWSPAGASRLQAATTDPLNYEELRADARGLVHLDPRTTIGGGAGWNGSRGADAAAQKLLPGQRTVSLDGSLGHRVSELDTLQLDAHAGQTVTSAPDGDFTSTYGSAVATWRRRLAPRAEGWLGAGASVLRNAVGGPLETHGAAQAGASREGIRLGLLVAASFTTFVDRFTGEASPMIDGSGTLRWLATPDTTLSAVASAGGRVDRETTLAGVDLRATRKLARRGAVEVGFVARWQRDRRPEFPSFTEGAVFVAASWDSGWIFGAPLP
jgi:hypothetical protein